MLARLAPDATDLQHRPVQRGGHQRVHGLGLMALDEDRCPAAAAQKRVQFVTRDARQHRRVGDLVAVEVQDRQRRAVANRVEKLVRMPGRGQRPGLGLAITHHEPRTTQATQATISAGLSNTAPKAWLSE